jgi:hypothetical protein
MPWIELQANANKKNERTTIAALSGSSSQASGFAGGA